MKIGNYDFEGPYSSISKLEDLPGIFAVHCTSGNGVYYLLDIGEAPKVRDEIEHGEKRAAWAGNCPGTLSVSVFYTFGMDGDGRKQIEEELKARLKPLCGQSRGCE